MLTLSEICRNLNFCNLCRDKVGGSGFRLAMIKVHGYSSDVTDFDCCQGKPWRDEKNVDLNLNSVFPTSQSVNEPAVTPEIVELSKQRFEICKTCKHATEDGHKCSLHKGCCFGRWRAQPENKCPVDPPKWDVKKKLETGN